MYTICSPRISRQPAYQTRCLQLRFLSPRRTTHSNLSGFDDAFSTSQPPCHEKPGASPKSATGLFTYCCRASRRAPMLRCLLSGKCASDMATNASVYLHRSRRRIFSFDMLLYHVGCLYQDPIAALIGAIGCRSWPHQSPSAESHAGRLYARRLPT